MLPKFSPYRNGEFSLYRKLYTSEIKVDYSILKSPIARNVAGRPANRAGARSTLKTVDRRKMTAEEEKIALVAVVAVKEE